MGEGPGTEPQSERSGCISEASEKRGKIARGVPP
jgi:hypothetical protein